MRGAMLVLALVTAGAAQAKDATKQPAEAKAAADRFQLDLPAADADPATAATPAEPASEPASSARYSIDTPIAQLLANFRSKAVLDRDMPGLSSDKNLETVKPLSLRRLAPLSGGRLTPELLEKVDRDLRRIE